MRDALSIRGARASASLKFHNPKNGTTALCAHPRRTRLGLIEVPHTGNTARSSRAHPRRTRLGLIEVRPSWTLSPLILKHPRRTRLGLIEVPHSASAPFELAAASEAHAPRPH